MRPRARSGGAGLLALILAGWGPACAGPRAVDRAARPLTGHLSPAEVPGARLEHQAGVVLASHWLSRAGTVVDRLPRGHVRWPALLAAGRVRLSTADLPSRVQLTIFPGPPAPSGIPQRTPRRTSCTARGITCSYVATRGAVEVRLPPGRGRRLAVLYCEWYVPLAERPPGARENPVVSASWGFRLR